MGATPDKPQKPAERPWWMDPPPVCEALLPIDLIRGQQNLNAVWEGEVLVTSGPMQGQTHRSVFKHLNHPGKLRIEMACTLIARLLGNQVPLPCLVRVSPDDLPGARSDLVTQGELLLFGCNYVAQDSFFEQLNSNNNDTLDMAVWNSFCGNANKAAKAAALDELIANWDRHSRNLRFDGRNWWLLDHDQALGPTIGQDVRQLDPTFRAFTNQVAVQLRHRRPNDHEMEDAARLSADKKDQVLAMAAASGLWIDSDPAVQEIWQHTSELLELMARRMPMLQQLLGERIGINSQTSLQWNPTTPPAAPSAPT